MSTSNPSYALGHTPAVLRSHERRTVANSAQYTVPYLRPNMTLLDVGSGPGTITIDFAQRLPQGHVYGLDPSAEVCEQATARAKERGVTNVTFVTGNILDWEACGLQGKQFDLVHAHQTILHIPDRLGALKAMKSVLLPEGILAVRDADAKTFIHYPHFPEIDRYDELLAQTMEAGGSHPYGGRELLALAMEAGYKRDQVTLTIANYCHTTPEEKKWWSEVCANRMLHGDLHDKALKAGVLQEELEKCSKAWLDWAGCENAFWATMHFQIICQA